MFNRPYALAPSYGEANFRLTFNDAKDRYTVIAFVNNAFDTVAYDRQFGSLLNSISGLGQTEVLVENLGIGVLGGGSSELIQLALVALHRLAAVVGRRRDRAT